MQWSPSRRRFLYQAGLVAGAGFIPEVRGERKSALPEVSPAAAGVDPAGILAFLDAAEAGSIELHSLLIARRGAVVASGWWAPYSSDLPHTLYSLSKSFTSLGVGLLVDAGKLSADDRVTSFFPDELPEKVSANLAAMRVRDLLTMATGHATDPTHGMVASPDWLRDFLGRPVEHEPGTKFVYNSGATYALSAIVQKISGRTLVDFLQPRLFDPLGIENPSWERSPQRICTGGWGLSLPTEAVAKFGILLLQGGLWNGRRIVSQEWVKAATSRQIPASAPPESTSDWAQGYGYQFWRCRHGAYRGDGAFGQFAIMLPDYETVVAMTAETGDMQAQLNLVWTHLLPALRNVPHAGESGVSAELRDRLASLALPLPKGEPSSGVADRVSGRAFRLEPDGSGAAGVISLVFENDRTRIRLERDGESHSVVCGSGRWVRGETGLPGTPPRLVGGGPPPGTLHPVSAAGAWTSDDTYSATLRFHESPHHDEWTFRFSGDRLTLSFRSSIAAMNPSAPDPRKPITGRLEPA